MVVFPKRLRYFLNVYAGCLNRVAGNTMSAVQRATVRAHQHYLRLFELEVDKDAPEIFVVFFNSVVEPADMALIQEVQLWIRCWCGAASGVGCQIRIVCIAHFLLVTRIKSPRTSNKSGLWPEVNCW